jgi:tripartite-type tricarboxylate transporter receptor subunit TctC
MKEEVHMKRFAMCLLIVGAVACVPAPAQSYPSKPIRLIVPSTPGSPPDVRARWLADKLVHAFGQPVVVDNKPGAAGSIGMAVAAKSVPDGYTLAFVHQGVLAINPHLYSRNGYDPIADFAPVTRLVVSPMLLAIHPEMAVRTVADLIRVAREKPGQLTFGSGGTGTPPHMAGELFKRMAKIDVMHVPYKGASPALVDLVAGRLSFTVDSVVIQLPHVRTGKIRALGVTSEKRIASLPDVPTVAESGLAGYEYWSWMGICAPTGTPGEIVGRLNRKIVELLGTPQAREWFAEQGGEPMGETPQQFAAFIKAEYARWGAVVREAGITVQ